jgi:DNA (cytosine-5)-methyltransferase 1
MRGGGKGPMFSDKSFTLATSNDQILILDGTRANDVRVYEDEIAPTVISQYGTGGGNVPMIFENRHDEGIRISEGGVVPTIRSAYGTGGGNVPMVFGNKPVAYDEFNDSISDVHHTLRAGTKQSTGVFESATVRRLTPTECERLQGFPDGWTEGQADTHRYKQMGNAVAVPVVSWIIERMVK